MSGGTISFTGRIIDDSIPKLELVDIREDGKDPRYPWCAYSKETSNFICALATREMVEKAIEHMDHSVFYR